MDLSYEEMPVSLQSVVADRLNRLCMDCETEPADWASIGFGTLICLKCAGEHRNLGVHITSVRSLTLDKWSERNILFLAKGGNAAFKAYLAEIETGPFATIRDKYRSSDIIYYRELLAAKVEGRLPKERDEDELSKLITSSQDSGKMGSGSPPTSPSKKEPDWTPDQSATECMICGTQFTILKRRHHCRRCGKCVCSNCAPKDNCRPILEWGMREPVRHCKLCFMSPNVQWG
jgi:Putative GTPase activating protein for Arf/FYVE zinc finger